MYKNKKEIEKWIKAFNPEQVERMRVDNYLDHIDEGDINGSKRFRGGGNWSVELVVPQAVLDLLPEWESKNWWQVGVVMDEDGEGIFKSEQKALDEYGVKSIDEINAHFARRFYDLSLDEEEWWISLEKEFEGKTGLPFEQIRVNYG
ncbi:hypothetical protein [Prochlorococcus marinus]|uniref:hypothetical protein n=1 Tax=Prochlorococcus marinus TaxID=1219 RepID=UPI0022B2CA4E|nr:hypothetical protein [Prochlorococcus marinus]